MSKSKRTYRVYQKQDNGEWVVIGKFRVAGSTCQSLIDYLKQERPDLDLTKCEGQWLKGAVDYAPFPLA